MTRLGWGPVLALGLVCACTKPGDDGSSGATSGSSSSTPSATPSTSGSAVTAPPPSAAAAAAPRTWKGAYKSAAATLSVLPEFSKTHWSDTQSTAGIGDGTLVVTVDGSSGRVTGEIQGVLGPATIEGLSADGKITASVRRTDPKDRGFSGTLVASVAGDHLEGTMNVSLGQASALRVGTFTLDTAR